MNRTARTQAAALALSVFATLGMLSSMNQLATQPHQDTTAAHWETPAGEQVVVIEAKRDLRS